MSISPVRLRAGRAGNVTAIPSRAREAMKLPLNRTPIKVMFSTHDSASGDASSWRLSPSRVGVILHGSQVAALFHATTGNPSNGLAQRLEDQLTARRRVVLDL